jgi:SWI/SNF-related matrix-associated actin-dependent regulator of chromatin subfamily A member 5
VGTDITTHSGKTKSTKKGKGEGGRHRGRMSEAAEDAKMKGDDGDNAGLVRIMEQPLLLSKKKGTMRDYQLEGLNWMVNLYIKGINGVLADEMGLGKTLQTISLLTFLREAYGIRGKHLVIVPKSTLGNWLREFKVWSPVFKTMKFHGTKDVRKKLCKEMLEGSTFDVCVTTFEMCSTEQTTLQKVKYVVVHLLLSLLPADVQTSCRDICTESVFVVGIRQHLVDGATLQSMRHTASKTKTHD